MSGVYSENLFKSSSNGTIYNRLYEELIKDRTDKVMFRSKKRALNDLLGNERPTAFYHILEAVFSMKEFECKVITPWRNRHPDQVAMALPKDSPYKKFFNYQVNHS